VRRSEQQLHAQLNPSVTVNGKDSRITVLLRIAPDEDNPYAVLSAQDEGGNALAVLTHQPGIGCPVEDGLPELIISRRRSGILARHAWVDALDRVMVARIRHQREVGYSD
jgi:plasmid stabilization system protein ParE